MKKKDIENIKTGHEIAKEISSVMLSYSRELSERTTKWLANNHYAEEIIARFCDEEQLTDTLERFADSGRTEAVERLATELQYKTKRRKVIRRITISSAVAAAMAVISFWIFTPQRPVTDIDLSNRGGKIVGSAEPPKETAKPILIVGGDMKIDLTGKNNVSVKEIKTEEMTPQGERVKDYGEWDKIIIPSKYTYSTTLCDGTKVFLNANSTLEYPAVFSDDIREVKLIGEAFFDVAKDSKRPFIVRTADVKVRVYGTKFNVNSYDSRRVKTSLVSGSVGVTYKDRSEVMITPSQMITVYGDNGENQIESFNSLKYEAWQNGFFRCDDEPIYLMLEDIAQWYGVTFEYEFEETKMMKVNASIKNSMTIEQVIKLLEVSSNVHLIKKGGTSYRVR